MAFGEVCRNSSETRVEASTTPVPPFALFECLAFQSGASLRANNAKSGTMPVEARSACRMGGLLSEVTQRVEDRLRCGFGSKPHHPRPEVLWAGVFRITEQ